MPLLISALLAVIALAGLVWNSLSGGLQTADGLFSSLIFATMFAIFALNSLSELRGWRTRRKRLQATPATTSATAAGSPAKAALSASSAAPSATASGTEQQPESKEEVWLDRARPVVALGMQASARPQEPADTIDGVTRGSILVRRGAPLPAGVSPQSETYLEDWQLLDADAARLGRAASESQLHFFYFVGPIVAIAFAFGRPQALRKALRQTLETVNHRHRNAVEITGLRTRNFLGLHRVEVTARMRHLQGTPFSFEMQPGSGVNGHPAPGTGMMPASPEEELSTEDIGQAA